MHMEWTSSEEDKHTAVRVTVPLNTQFLPGQVESTAKRYIRYWKEAVQAIAKVMGTDKLEHDAAPNFQHIILKGPDGFLAFIIPAAHLQAKLKATTKYPNGITEGNTIIRNKGRSHEPKPQKDMSDIYRYYQYIPPVIPTGSYQIT